MPAEEALFDEMAAVSIADQDGVHRANRYRQLRRLRCGVQQQYAVLR